MEKLAVKSESDEISLSPSDGGAIAALPKFTPGTKGTPKKITQIKFIDPEKIKQLGLEETIAAAVQKLKVKTQGSNSQNKEGSQLSGLFGTAKSVLSQNSRKISNASKIKELSDGGQHGRPTTIDIQKLIKKKLLSGKRSNSNLKNDADDKFEQTSQSFLAASSKPTVKKAIQTTSAASKTQNEVVVIPNSEEQFRVKKRGRPKKIQPLEKDKNLEDLTESELSVRKATEQLRLVKPKKYKSTPSALRIPAPSKTIVSSSKAKNAESTQVSDESPKKSCSNEDSSKIPSFLNLRHYLHHKRSQNEGSDNSSDSTEASRDKQECNAINLGEEEEILEKKPSFNPSPGPISVLKVRKKGHLMQKPEETLVPGKIDVILTTDPKKDIKDEIKVLSELQKPSEESDDEPRTVVLKVINRDLKSGKIEMELIDPLIQPEKVQAVVTNSTVDSEEAPENAKDRDLDVKEESTAKGRSPENRNLKDPEVTQIPQTSYSTSSSSDEALDSSDLFKKHLEAIFSAKPAKTVEEVVRKLSFSDPCNAGAVSEAKSTKMLKSSKTVHTKYSERGVSLEKQPFVDYDNSKASVPTCPLNFGGFFKKITPSQQCHGMEKIEEPAAAEETAVDFLLTVKNKEEITTEESLPSDCNSVSLSEFDNLFDIKESSSSDKVLKKPNMKSSNDFDWYLDNNRDPLTVEELSEPYYELLGFKGDEGVIANINHCDDILPQAEEAQNLKPIIIEYKILSDQEKIDTMAVLSQAGRQLSPSMTLPAEFGQVSNQSENPVIIMGDDLPAQEEVELITVYSMDNSSDDLVEDYGCDGDVKLVSVVESPESSNHSSASKSVLNQDQDQVELLKILSSAETTTDQVIVLSVEHNAQALGDAEGSIEFPFDSPIKKSCPPVEIVENVEEESPDFEQIKSGQEAICEQHTRTNEDIIKIEHGDNEMPIEDKESNTNETTDGRSSLKSSSCDVTSDQSSFRDITHISSDDQESTLKSPLKSGKDTEPNKAKREATEEKRARKSFKPVPKLRLALKNKKKSANISMNSGKITDDSKQNMKRDEAKESSCEDADQKAENCVVHRKEENQPMKSILRRNKVKIENQSLLTNPTAQSKKEDTIHDHLKTEEDIKNSNEKTETILHPNGKNPKLQLQKDRQSKDTKFEDQSTKKCDQSYNLHDFKRSPYHESKSTSTNQEENLLYLQGSCLQSESSDFDNSFRTCLEDKVGEQFSVQPDSLQTGNHEEGGLKDSKNKVTRKDDQNTNELKTLKPKQKTLVDYFSSRKQNQNDNDQFISALHSSLNHSTEVNQVSKEDSEVVSYPGKSKDCDLGDVVKNDLEQGEATSRSSKINRETKRFGVLKQNHRKNKQITSVSTEQKHQDSVNLKDHEKNSSLCGVSKIESKESSKQFMERGESGGLSRTFDDKSDDILNKLKKKSTEECEIKCYREDLNIQQPEQNLQIVSETFHNDVKAANLEQLTHKKQRGRSGEKSKISILEKWSHTEGITSSVEMPNTSETTEEDESNAKSMLPKAGEATLLNCEENLEDQKSFEAETTEKIKSTPNPIVKQECNRKFEADSISKGYSVMKVAGEPSGHGTIKRILGEVEADANSESTPPNLKRIKGEDDSITPGKPAQIPKKRGRKPKSLLPEVSPVIDTMPKPPNVPVSEVSRRGRIIKLTEKRRLSEIVNEPKAKSGRKRKIQEPENEAEVKAIEGKIITNVENKVIPLKKLKKKKIVYSEKSDSDSDVPLSEKISKVNSKNKEISAPSRKRRAPKNANKTNLEVKKTGGSRKRNTTLYLPIVQKRGKRKYDIEIKLHPKLLVVTKREDLYKEDEAPSPPVKLKKGEVQCGLCKEVTLEKTWQKHLESHYCIGWKEGEPPLDVEDYRTVLNWINTYIRRNHIAFVYCRLCGMPMKSAIGLLFHLETCNATLQEKKEMNFTCVCGKVLTSKLWAPPHLRSCKGPPDQTVEELELPEPEPSTCHGKRKAVLKAEKLIKDKIKEELQEETLEDLVKPIVNKTVGLFTKWRFQLRKKGITSCVGIGCDFTSKDLPEMHEHSKTCDKILRCGFICVRCKFEDAERDVVLKHVEQKHKPEKTQDFQDSGSDAKVGSESSDSDNESGDERSGEKKKQHKRIRKIPSKQPEMCSDKWKKVFPFASNSDYQNEAANWTRNFRESNYAKKAIFTNAVPEATILPSTSAHQYFAHNVESMKFSYNFEKWCNRKFSSSIKPELWTKLNMFESTIRPDEIMTFIGGPVTNVAWVPVGDHETSKQYLAVTYKKDLNEYAKYRDDTPYKTCMLIFQVEHIPTDQLKSLTPLYGVVLDSGPILDIKFLPSGGYAPALNRLGLVTIVSRKTDPEIYSLPLRIFETENCDIKGVPIVKLKTFAILRFDRDSGFDWTRQCTAVVWSKFKGHHIIAGAAMNGYVAVWDISEEDNLNQIKNDGERSFIPTNFFMASDRRVLDIDLHYDAYGARWLMLTTESKELKFFDLREITPCALVTDDPLRTMVYNLEWPIYWENPILCYSDEIQKALTGIYSFSPIGLMYHYRKAIKCASGAVTGSFIDWENSHVFGCMNGDLVAHRCCEWRHNTRSQVNLANKYFSYTDMIYLGGDQTKLTKLDPNSLNLFDKDYKEKYGLVISKFQRCGKDEEEIKSEREVHFTFQEYVKINRVAGNPNAFGRELIAAGYENGLLRICLYTPRESS